MVVILALSPGAGAAACSDTGEYLSLVDPSSNSMKARPANVTCFQQGVFTLIYHLKPATAPHATTTITTTSD